MLAKITSAALEGINAYPVEIEVDMPRGMPSITIVGLPDTAVKESRDRVRSAIRNGGFHFPPKKITINLAPADRKKEGPSFDLPIAIGILAASGQLESTLLESVAVVGELALEGKVRPVDGCLSIAMTCRTVGIKRLIVPRENAAEAAVVEGLDVIGVGRLDEVYGYLAGRLFIEPHRVDMHEIESHYDEYELDFADVKGQEHVKRGLLVTAAGGHNALMIGPPGSGKTMLAQRLPSILPRLTREEALETTRLHSAAGLLRGGRSLQVTRPFRSPHHTTTFIGMVGGGTVPRPGEVSLAHNGVLFLDEMPEFGRRTLEVLRQPLEERQITIDRVAGRETYPCNIMLIGAMNPCPCGYYTDPRKECRCSPLQIRRYMGRISGPLLDRIDVHLEVAAVPLAELSGARNGVPSAALREQITQARRRQRERFADRSTYTNANMNTGEIRRFCRLQEPAERLLKRAMEELGLSARAYTRIKKVARTIADLEGASDVETGHIAEAVQYRSLDRAVTG